MASSLQGDRHFIMRHVWFQFQQELFIFGIIDGPFQVIACEGTNRLIRLPEREKQKLRFVLVRAAQDLNALITGNCALVFQTRLH
jgi:hypothetical protein